jgi:hypothetical protein
MSVKPHHFARSGLFQMFTEGHPRRARAFQPGEGSCADQQTERRRVFAWDPCRLRSAQPPHKFRMTLINLRQGISNPVPVAVNIYRTYAPGGVSEYIS